MNHFWIVWREDGSSPTVKHDFPEAAKREAERLARANPGATFHVLQVIGTAQYQQVHWHIYGEVLPF